MKKTVKIPVIVASSVVAAILVAVLILCVVTVRPMKRFADYKTVRITTNRYALPDVPLNDPDMKYKAKIDKGLKETGFSIMHAMLEFVGNYGPEKVTEKDEKGKTVEEDGKPVYVKYTVKQARTACAATEDSFMLELAFAEERTWKADGDTIRYDRLLMNVKTTQGELHWVEVYPYLSELDGAQNDESADYRITPLRLRMNTSPLYNALTEIADDIANA